MSETTSAPFRGVDLGLPVKPITLTDTPGAALGRSLGAVLVDIPAALSRQSIVVSQWAIAANLVLARITGALPPPGDLHINMFSGNWTPLPPGTYYYQVTATDAVGETVGSNEVSQALTLVSHLIPSLSWSAVPGAVNYKLYRSTTSGGERTSPALIATLAAPTTTFLDQSTPAAAGAVPASNTTLSVSTNSQFGRLGRLLGGPLRHRAVQTTGTGISAALVAPWETPFVFPDDISNLASLWDGEADASPPMEAWNNPMPVDIATTLNSPIALSAGEQLGIFLGITPMVGQNVALYVVNGRWSLTYDLA